MHMKIIFTIGLILLSIVSFGQIDNVVPYPAYAQIQKGRFELNAKTQIAFHQQTAMTAGYLHDYIKTFLQLDLRMSNADSVGILDNNTILLNATIKSPNNSYYQLKIDSSKIVVKGGESGVFYGVQTLIQLLNLDKKINIIPALLIQDSARMSYRGLHLDCCRHFFSKSFIKKYLDLMAHYKLNTFHWHLTDDQGWRIEIKKYPALTKTGGCRAQTLIGPYGTEKYDGKRYCGFYTQEEIKEIVAYAASRYIDVIPEIEMPGHSMAALAAYPSLGCTGGPYQTLQTWGVSDEVMCAGKDSTFLFLQDVIDEVVRLFPSPYIHIGGDECPKERWKNCEACKKRIGDEKLRDANGLQSYFVKRMEQYINSKGKKIIGWDEIMEGGLAPNATVMSWRGEAGGIEAAKQKHNVIMTPGNPLYFDHSQSLYEDSLTQGGYNSLKNVYDYDPVPKTLEISSQQYILGAQANMWTEYMDNEKKVEYMLCPRITALAEILWTPKNLKSWTRFEQAIPQQLKKLELWHYNYSKAFYDLESNINIHKGIVEWQLSSRPGSKIKYLIPNDSIVYDYQQPIPISQSGKYSAWMTDSTNRKISSMISNEFHVNKATGKNIMLKNKPHKSYANGGADALVDGIQNTMGMQKSSQFLGFWGPDLESVIDLKDTIKINSISIHAFEQAASWIYAPSAVRFYWSNDGKTFQKLDGEISKTGKRNLIYEMHSSMQARYIKVEARNFGIIPDQMPGAGNKAWLFVDEIVID